MLTREDVEKYDADGFVICTSVFERGQMDRLRGQIDRVIQSSGYTNQSMVHRHIDSRVVYDLCSTRSLVDCLVPLLGSDILLWHTRFFDKPPGQNLIPWHQDMEFWRLDPPLCVTAWIAVDRADRNNGCLEVIPGSHKWEISHIPSRNTGRFGLAADPECFNQEEKIMLELEPGQVVLFDGRLLHCSPQNNSTRRRLALAARYISTNVTVCFEQMCPTFPELGAQLVSGRDNYGFNRSAFIPPSIVR